MRPESQIFAKKTDIWNSVLMKYIGKQMTLYHVHDGDFEIKPNEPKLMIGVHFLEKNAKTREK